MKFIFYESHHPTRHIKYKKRYFVPCYKSITANKLRSANLERFITTYRALIVPNWSKWPKW